MQNTQGPAGSSFANNQGQDYTQERIEEIFNLLKRTQNNKLTGTHIDKIKEIINLLNQTQNPNNIPVFTQFIREGYTLNQALDKVLNINVAESGAAESPAARATNSANSINPQVSTDDTTISRIFSFDTNALEAQDIPVAIEDNKDTKLVVLVPKKEDSEPIFYNPEHLTFENREIKHPYGWKKHQFEIWSCTLKNGETTLSDIKHLTDDECNEIHDNNSFENMYAHLNRLMGGESILPSDMPNIPTLEKLIKLGDKLNKSIDLTNNDQVTDEIKKLISRKLKENRYTDENRNKTLKSTEYSYSNLVLLINDDIQAGAPERPAAAGAAGAEAEAATRPDTSGDEALAKALAGQNTFVQSYPAAGAAGDRQNLGPDTSNDEALARALAGQDGHNTHEAGAATGDEDSLNSFFETELKNEMDKWGPNFNLDIFLKGYQTQQEKDLITKIYNRSRQNQQ